MSGLGALVIIPGLLGLFSMSYAVSTVTPSPLIYLGAGIVWFFIVVAIDRYLVLTMQKSAGKGGLTRSVAILSRYVFAVLIGLAVSHPLAMLWFDGSIS